MVDDAQEIQSTRPVVDARRQAARRPEAQRRRQRLAVAIVGTLLLIVVGIIVAGYLVIFVLPPRQLIIRVNDVTVTRGDMVKLLRMRQATSQAMGDQYSAGQDAFDVLQVIMEVHSSISTPPTLFRIGELSLLVRPIVAAQYRNS